MTKFALEELAESTSLTRKNLQRSVQAVQIARI
jgi:hypothetical protein